jgi:hypothetical protein
MLDVRGRSMKIALQLPGEQDLGDGRIRLLYQQKRGLVLQWYVRQCAL